MRLVRLAIAALLLNAEVGRAQKTITADEPRDSTHAQHQAPFFTRTDALLGLGFGIGTIAMFPLDKHVARRLQTRQDRQGFLQNASTGVEVIASPGAYFIGGGLYAFGRAFKYDRVA